MLFIGFTLTVVGTLLTLFGAAIGADERLFLYTVNLCNCKYKSVALGVYGLTNPHFPNSPRNSPNLQNFIQGQIAETIVKEFGFLKWKIPNAENVDKIVATYSTAGPWQIDFQYQKSGQYSSAFAFSGDILINLFTQYHQRTQNRCAFRFVLIGTILIVLSLIVGVLI